MLITHAPHARAQQATRQQPARLMKIEFEGLAHVSQSEAVEASGLQVGQAIDQNVVDAAAERLLKSGLFKNLSYKMRKANGEATVSFKVEELRRSVPVIFDNFVWFTDEELKEAVRRKVPDFDGLAPEGGGITETIRNVLQDLLRVRSIKGQVEYMPYADAQGRNPEHVFTVKGANLRVCEIRYPGAAGIQEDALVQKSSAIFNNEYSRTFVESFVESNLIPLYHERGRLRVSFLPPKLKLQTEGECQGGVAVIVQVDEGQIYLWEKAEWAGSQALAPQELDAALGMKQNDLANALKIEKGAQAVRKAYGRKGFLAAALRPEPVFDDANRRVTYRFRVEEGPQFRMGELFITGLSEKDSNNLHGRWGLLSKEIFDAGYLEQFFKKNLPEFLNELRREGQVIDPRKIESNVKPNRDKLTVDVTLNFKP
ncbi:MAG: hypothetical protein LC754_12700 [Acidobacteria bacterium]|nr:hypothetical protein [Acidobacteriota bacterium]